MPAKPFIRDASGLLSRVPELEDIADEDRRVLLALESGEAHAVYAALRWGRFFRRIRKNADVAKELLENRRLFLTPSRGRLWLATYNGIGATFYGEADPDLVDGTYIATHFLTLVFVPIFPLGQYLVKNTSTSGQESYYVLGKVPFRILLRLWSRLITLALFVGFLATLLSLLRSAQHNGFYVVNEIGTPITAEIADHVLQVDSSTQKEIDLPTGKHAISIYGPEHRLLEKGEVRIRPGHKVIAWNVLGAASLLHGSVEYRLASMPTAPPQKPTVHCGDRTIVYRSVDYVFTEPPKSMKMSGSGETRTYLAIAEPGSATCARYLAQSGRKAEAATLAKAQAQLNGYELPFFQNSIETLLRGGTDDMLVELAQKGRDAHPISVAHHRIYQNVMEEVGRIEAVRAEYAHPLMPPLPEADAAYLAARTAPFGDPQLQRAAELMQRFPEHGASLAWAASVYCYVADYAHAAPLYQRMKRLHPALYQRDLSMVVQSLVGTDQATAALEAIVDEFDNGEGRGSGTHATQLPLAAMYASVAAKVKGADSELLIRRLTGDNPADVRAVAKMEAGLPLPSTNVKMSAGARTIWTAQEQAISSSEEALRVDPAALREMPSQIPLLVYAEAVRTNSAQLETLHDALSNRYPRRFLDKAKRYLREGSTLQIADGTTRAMLLFARSRNTELPSKERQNLRAEALRLAILPGALTRAIASWTQHDEAAEAKEKQP